MWNNVLCIVKFAMLETDEVKVLTGEEFKQLSDQEKCLPENWYLYDQDEVGLKTSDLLMY